MKKDLKDIIVDTARIKEEKKSLSKIKKIELELEDDRPCTKSKYNYKYQRDRVGPLYRFLLSKIGQSWNKIWGEICQNNDNRNVRGNHLRDHVLDYVANNGISREPKLFFLNKSFYVDTKGILRIEIVSPRKRKEKDNPYIRKYKNRTFLLSTNGWYETDGVVYLGPYRALKSDTYVSPVILKRLCQFSEDEPFRFAKENIMNTTAIYYTNNWRQLSKKEIKELIK